MYVMAHLAQDAKTKTGLCGFFYQNTCQHLAKAVLVNLPSTAIASWLIQLLSICSGCPLPFQAAPSPCPAARQRNHHNLHSHCTVPSPAVWIFTYWLEKGIKNALNPTLLIIYETDVHQVLHTVEYVGALLCNRNKYGAQKNKSIIIYKT